jgi:triacylglycerol esterase/lipase EstA (alpha/beta hydrolase family)
MWTAVTLAGLVVAGAAAYATFAAHAYAAGVSPWLLAAGLPALYAVILLFVTVLWFVLGWMFRARRPPEVTLSAAARATMFWREYRALFGSLPRMVFYRWLVPNPPPAPARLPVVLVHGVGCNAGVWTGLRRYLVARGIAPVYALSYGPPLASIEHFAEQLGALIAEVRGATGAAQVVVVTHSMGGLVARAYLRRFGGASVRKLITIGTPHNGSMHAWTMAGEALAQMRPGNAWLAELNRAGEGAAGVPVVSIWSWHDSMVTPQDSSRLPWAENIVVTGVAHNALLGDRAIWERVANEIGRDVTSGSPASVARMPSVPA